MKWSLVATAVLLVVGGLSWFGGYKEGVRDANSPVRRAALLQRLSHPAPTPAPVKPSSEKEWAAIELQRLGILSLNSIRLFDAEAKPRATVEYKLTNNTDRAIHQASGHIELYDPGHRSLGRFAIVLPFDVAAHDAIAIRRRLDLNAPIRSALADGKFTAEFRVDDVYYKGGFEQRFAAPEKDGTFSSTPRQ